MVDSKALTMSHSLIKFFITTKVGLREAGRVTNVRIRYKLESMVSRMLWGRTFRMRVVHVVAIEWRYHDMAGGVYLVRLVRDNPTH